MEQIGRALTQSRPFKTYFFTKGKVLEVLLTQRGSNFQLLRIFFKTSLLVANGIIFVSIGSSHIGHWVFGPSSVTQSQVCLHYDCHPDSPKQRKSRTPSLGWANTSSAGWPTTWRCGCAASSTWWPIGTTSPGFPCGLTSRSLSSTLHWRTGRRSQTNCLRGKVNVYL